MNSIKVQLAAKLSIRTIREDLFEDVFYVHFRNPIETDCFIEPDVTVIEKDATVNANLLRDVCKGLLWESVIRVMPQTENLRVDIEFLSVEEIVRYRKVFLEVDDKCSKWTLELHCEIEKKLNEMANELQTVFTDNMKKIIANMISE